jgi:hypothetical protein
MEPPSEPMPSRRSPPRSFPMGYDRLLGLEQRNCRPQCKSNQDTEGSIFYVSLFFPTRTVVS